MRFALMIVALATMAMLPVSAQKQWDQIKFPKMNKVQKIEPQRFEVANGMTLYILEDNELPVINVRLRFWGGEFHVDAEKAGLLDIFSTAMREGGTETNPGEKLDELLADRAASIEMGFTGQVGFVSVSMLKEDADLIFTLLADLIMNPAFPDEKIELAKTQARSSISRRNDEAGGIIGREFRKLIYGADSPMANQVEYATLDNITRDDLLAFHQRFFHPNNMRMGVIGDFKTNDMKKLLEDKFSAWKKNADFKAPEPPKVDYEWRNQIYVINKEDVNQSQIRIGHIGGLLNEDNYYALDLFSEVLGGSFGSRLFNEVRTKRGLAYSSFGVWSPNYNFPGTFLMGGGTKTETTVEALEVFMETLRKTAAETFSKEDMNRAKDGILNSFVFNFDSKVEQLERFITYEFYGYPKDFLQKYQEGIQKVSAKDVKKAASEFVHPDKMVVLVVGKLSEIKEGLAGLGFGEPIEVDITIPTPKKETAVVTAESANKGKEIREQIIKAHGGADKLEGVLALRTASDVKLVPQNMQLTVTETYSVKDKNTLQIVKLPMGEMKTAVNGASGWMAQGPRSMDMPASRVDDTRKSLMRKIPIMLSMDELVFSSLGDKEWEGATYAVVQVTHPEMDDLTTDLWINADGHPVRATYSTTNPQTGAPSEADVSYSDYKMVDGFLIAHKQVVTIDGAVFTEAVVTKATINPELGENFFAKPEQ